MLKINGNVMPEPSELVVSPEKIWSSDTGRGDNGEMVGDVVATKITLEIKWNVLSASQIKTIQTQIDKPFFQVTFKNPMLGNEETTKKFYAGTPSYPVYSYVNGLPQYTGIGVNLIEK